MPHPHEPAPFGGDEEVPSPPNQASSLSEEWDDDDSLILWMLSLTPTQRLKVAQGFVHSVHALRHGRRT